MSICKLENCKIKDIYIKEHCFYGYREPECWKGWIGSFILMIKLIFKRKNK